MSIELEEFEPGRWRVKKPRHEKLRSENLPLPFVISDTMDAIEQVDGKIYTSKSSFRAVGRAHGLTEVGTEKFKPKERASSNPQVRKSRRAAIKTAIQKYKSGQRAR